MEKERVNCNMKRVVFLSWGRGNGPVPPGVLVHKEKAGAAYISPFDSETDFLSKPTQQSSIIVLPMHSAQTFTPTKGTDAAPAEGLHLWDDESQALVTGSKESLPLCPVLPTTPAKTVFFLLVSPPSPPNTQEYTVVLKNILTRDLPSSPSNFLPS